MTPSTESYCGLSLLVLAYHRECSPSFANSTTACKHACGWMMGECSEKFDVGQDLRQECVLAPLLLNMVFTAVLRVAEKYFLADAVITDNMVQIQRKERRRGGYKGKPRSGKVDRWGEKEEEEVEAQRLWGMLYADDAGIVSQSPGGLERMTTVSDGKTDIMCLQTDYGGEVSFTITAAGQVYRRTINFVYLSGAISADRKLSVEITRRLQRAWACFQRYKM